MASEACPAVIPRASRSWRSWLPQRAPLGGRGTHTPAEIVVVHIAPLTAADLPGWQDALTHLHVSGLIVHAEAQSGLPQVHPSSPLAARAIIVERFSIIFYQGWSQQAARYTWVGRR